MILPVDFMTYGNGLIETVTYNNRLQPTTLLTYNPATNANVLDLAYGYTNSAGANNGNVTSFNSTATQIFMRTYTYDSLNRLSTLFSPTDASGCYGLSWTYDLYGNRLNQATASGSCLNASHAVLANNRLADTGFTYDAAGNMTSDNVHTYTYDAESRLIQVDGTAGNCSTATACYVYDAEGLRLQKTTGGVTTAYLRRTDGNVVAETDGGNTLLRAGYVYSGGKLLAEYENGTTYFVHEDHLGSTRVMTSVNGSIYDSMDYLPYGEQIAGGSGSTHKFTAEERDGESGIDNFLARYMGSSLGRFMSPDPDNAGAINGSPQSWNAYSYVANSPLNSIDPDGRDCIYTSGATSDGVYVATETGTCSQSGGKYVDGTINQGSYAYDNGVLSYTYSNGDVGGLGIVDFNKGDSVTGADIAAAAIQGVQMAGAPITAAEITKGAWDQWIRRHPGVATIIMLGGGLAMGGAEDPVGGEFNEYEDVTSPGSRFPNRQVNLTPSEFGANLEAGGFSKTVKGDVTIYTKGDSQYTVYPKATSTGGPSVQVKIDGVVVQKIRLQ